MSNTNTVIFESYLKVKNINQLDDKMSEKTSIAFFILNVKEKTFTYKKSKESSVDLAKHIDKEILNYEETVDTNDKGICDYPIGFQIITKQRIYVLYANSRLIYTRWIDCLKLLFKTLNNGKNKKITPETSPEKAKNFYLNPSFKQQEKSPISSKSKLANNNNNYSSNVNNTNDKVIGFDEDLINVLDDFDENESKKTYAKKNYNNNWPPNFNINSENISSFEKGLRNSEKEFPINFRNHNNIEDNYNEVFTVSNNPPVSLTELNQGWDKDFKEIKKMAVQKNTNKPTYKKSSELINEMSRITNKPTSTLDQSMLNDNKPSLKYKSNILLFDDPSLHIRQSVNEAYLVENLHYGIEDNLNKSIDYKQPSFHTPTYSQNTSKKTSLIPKKSKEQDKQEKNIDIGNSNIKKKIVENSDNSWTFTITLPVKNEK